MNAEDYARAKTIFFSAIDLPHQERLSYVHEACSGADHIEREVKSLLAHHRSRTLLPRLDTVSDPSQSEAMEATLPSPRPKSSAGYAGESQLVLAELWDENRELLRRRLKSFAIILASILGYSIIAHAFKMSSVESMLGRTVCLAVVLVSLFFLRARPGISLSSLRFLEVVIAVSIGVMLVVIDLLEMQRLSVEGDTATIISANLWNFTLWSLLILTYGVFIPNTWRRAALLLLPIAAIPYAVQFVSQQWYPVVGEALKQARFQLPLPLPLIAAGIAMSAAQVIHGARLSAFRLRRLAQYELIREIGSGGMGKVYEGRHVMLKRPCAIKVIQPDRSHDNRLLTSFEEEARATSKLTHPHTVEVYDFGQTNEGLFFYVMELLPGKNLRELVDTTGPLEPPRAIHFLIQICGALQEAHGLGLIHRDIKPANIFASERGGIQDYAKLLDFGLVRQIDRNGEHQKLPANAMAGTPAYMSPEQFVNYPGIDHRSDLYSLGAVAYFLLVGRPPFERDTYVDFLVAHVQEPVIPPLSLNPRIGLELNQIVLKCLEKAPKDRYASAKQLKDALRSCAAAKQWPQNDSFECGPAG